MRCCTTLRVKIFLVISQINHFRLLHLYFPVQESLQRYYHHPQGKAQKFHQFPNHGRTLQRSCLVPVISLEYSSECFTSIRITFEHGNFIIRILKKKKGKDNCGQIKKHVLSLKIISLCYLQEFYQLFLSKPYPSENTKIELKNFTMF